MENLKDVILLDTLDGIDSDRYEGYLVHALCLAGSCTFIFNGHDFTLREGDLMIIRKGKFLEKIKASEDFAVRTLYVTHTFIELCTPQTNYGMKGQMSLFQNPIMNLNREQKFVCERDFRWVDYRLSQTGHAFYRELRMNAVQAAILDSFDFHSVIHRGVSVSTQNATLMNRFLDMLERGDYRGHREVTFYAEALCVTPKYLSEVAKRVSGYPANYWINRYTSLDIARLLRDRSLTFAQIAQMFRFSSAAYFSRYVQRTLGLKPSEYRD